MKAADLRGILHYTARFRDRVFVLNVDSAVLASDNFRNLLLDISVLRSLNIRIVLVHGCSVQVKALADEIKLSPSDLDGMGITDAATLRLAILASNRLAHEILMGLNDTDQRAVITNAITAHPAGILNGVDQQFTGQVDRVDVAFLETLLNQDVIPIISPLGFDGNGQTYRVNSDSVALEVSEALMANKLIHITTSNGARAAGHLSAQVSVEEADDYIRKHRSELSAPMLSKLRHGVRACRNGVQRVHIIDGTQDEALLSEIFSNEGVGTMIHANEYLAIRPAMKKDAGMIMKLIRESVESQQLAPRTRRSIEERIGDFYVFEIDRNIVGCAGLKSLHDAHPPAAELECLFVAEAHENRGIGGKLMLYAEEQARQRGARRLLALSTQAFNYFAHKGGFREGSPDMLPPSRRAAYDKSGRHSKVLFKDLT
ncbi:MAG: amino-acid N-acetyltransferase [Kiritimatiellae bacterium]|nr:amino-acid N-acetyltransferase [Kiritimatiellia bacterium]MCO5060521.1 amino-acid N-acetyltransferase [Kiritimatiellia bacterium]